jgi:twitching motility protein PilT
MALNLKEIIENVVKDGASDLHLTPGLPPILRIKKQLVTKENFAPLTIDDVEYFLSQVLSNDQRKLFEINKELFLSVNFGNNVRFRITVFNTKGGYPAVALRTIPFKSPNLESLNLPPVIKKASEFKQGLVLVTGPTGQGKSTTIAGLLDKINNERNEHIVTIEDPIEFLFESKKSFIQQMEVSIDTISWNTSLRSVSRVDPNIIMVGEIYDSESLMTVLNLAETGHLVISSLHTNSASQTIDRIVASFPESIQGQIRNQLSMVLEMVISQRLVETLDGDVLPAVEILIPNAAIKNMIRSNQIYAIDNVIATSANLGMMSLDSSLAELVNSGKVSLNNALRYSLSPENLTRLVKKQ